MDSGGSGPSATTGRTWWVHAIKHLRPCSEKTIRYFWLILCAILAAVALFNYSQAHQIQGELAQRRLLEISLQDLIVQSTALHHLGNQHTYETKLGLETRGYSSPQELLNQLAARLAVIEAINPHSGLTVSASSLREHLIVMDQQLARLGRPDPKRIELWLIELGVFNVTLKNDAKVADDKVNQLQRNNLILPLIVLLHSVSFVSLTLWRQSTLRKRFAIELLHLSNQARTDPLTGLLNRRGWQDLSSAYLRKMQRENQLQGSVAIIDIDYFKQYNDTFGHEAGDIRLREFAETLRSNFRPVDLIARVGGEEFAVLLPNCTADDTQRIVDRIRLNGNCTVGFSAGICNIAHLDSIDRTMAEADQALYQAKNKGRNRSCLGKVSS
ncbi:diguanylate cyclase domain-containing protein [Limnobacter sp.]|uniref:GGDEF domain-containing protein n=1 Tax=Limnobacter sp. TaxID=2003368 RepID=UPI0037493F5B